MQDGALPSRRVKGRGLRGGTQSSLLYGNQKKKKKMTKAEASWGGKARRGSGNGAGGSQGERRRSRSQRYHGRLQGRGLLGWAYETVFVVALWLRQENRRFSSSRVTSDAQIWLPGRPCPLVWPRGARPEVATGTLCTREQWLERGLEKGRLWGVPET